MGFQRPFVVPNVYGSTFQENLGLIIRILVIISLMEGKDEIAFKHLPMIKLLFIIGQKSTVSLLITQAKMI